MFNSYIAPFAKAYVPAAVGFVIVFVLAPLGIVEDMTVKEALTILFTSLLSSAGVYFTPNQK